MKLNFLATVYAEVLCSLHYGVVVVDEAVGIFISIYSIFVTPDNNNI